MNKILVFLSMMFCCAVCDAQSRLVLNGGIVTLNNGGNLVVDNAAANAITRNSGHIISEGENNVVKWNIGTTTGTYIVPFGYGLSNYLPVTFTKAAGTGAGNFLFSTYHTGWQNSAQLPAGVTSFNGATGDNSAYVLDRFWQINAQGYTAKPTLTNLVLTYLDGEYTATGNTIAETGLKAQRWNSSSNGWSDMAANGTVNTTANTVTISSISAANLYAWWVLVDQASTLPLNFLSFEANKQSDGVQLKWTTSDETNVSGFAVERSTDGLHYQTIATVVALNLHGPNNYFTTDNNPSVGTNFYRIKEIDRDGRSTYSVIRNIGIDGSGFVSVYPNPTIDYKIYIDLKKLPADRYTISIHDVGGSLVDTYHSQSDERIVKLNLSGKLKKGLYIINITAAQFAAQQKIVAW